MNDELIDYEGKLNKHEDYLKMLNILEKKCSYIGIVDEHEIVNTFKDKIIKIENSSSWWSEITSHVENIYYIKASNELFTFLKKYETFCKTIVYRNIFIPQGTLRGKTTNFGYNDIAFFDNKDNILLSTTTHEGFIYVNFKIAHEFENE